MNNLKNKKYYIKPYYFFKKIIYKKYKIGTKWENLTIITNVII